MGSPAPTTTLFAYGTLVFPEVWRRVTGDTEARRSERAILERFALLRVRDADFPGLVADAGAPPVPGVLYYDLDKDVLGRLDAYEDCFYERITVSTRAERHAGPVACDIYAVPVSQRATVLTEEPWSLEDFEARHLLDFSRRLREEFPAHR